MTRISAAYGNLAKSKRYIDEAKTRGLMNDEVEGLLTALGTKAQIAELREHIRKSGVVIKSWAQVRRERDRT